MMSYKSKIYHGEIQDGWIGYSHNDLSCSEIWTEQRKYYFPEKWLTEMLDKEVKKKKSVTHWLPTSTWELMGSEQLMSLEQGSLLASFPSLIPAEHDTEQRRYTVSLCSAPTSTVESGQCVRQKTDPCILHLWEFGGRATLTYSTWARENHLSFWGLPPEAGHKNVCSHPRRSG